MIRSGLRLLMLTLCLTLCLATAVYAEESDYQNTAVTAENFGDAQKFSDGDRLTYSAAGESAAITLSRPDGIAAIYLEFDRLPRTWTLTDPASGKSMTCGENAFLHEYVDVAALLGTVPQTLRLEFEKGTVLADVYGFSEGTLPAFVQRWQPPCEQADLLLFSSHSDDEQLFFAGVLPYYAVERKLQIQVVYLVQHFYLNDYVEHKRPHEQLDGLWGVGVRNYPIISEFPDLYSESKDRQTALNSAIAVYEAAGYTYEDVAAYLAENIRRFKPLVVLSHDLNGEYGHGTHVLCASALTEVIGQTGDAEKYPESAAAYGTWEAEKLYLHLYEENPIVMDFDTPLESLGGKTAFQVTQEQGFSCHKSQHWTWFYRWIYGADGAPITKAADIQTYSPCLYGLYTTKVGPDTEGGDFFENVMTYAEREAAARAAAEAQAKAEAEAAAKAAAEAQAKAEAEAAAKAAAEAEVAHRKKVRVLTAVGGITVGAGIVLLIWARLNRRRKTRRKRTFKH